MFDSLRTSFHVPSLPPAGGDGGDRAAAVAAVAATYPAAPSGTLLGVSFVRPLPGDEDGGDSGIAGGNGAGAGGDVPDPADPYAAYRALFVTLPLPPVAAAPADDATWARLRVAGPNPFALHAATAAAAADWGVTDAHLRAVPGCGDDTIATAAVDHRLYAVDHVEMGEFLAAGAAAATAAEKAADSQADPHGRSGGDEAENDGTGGWGEVVHSPRALLVLPATSNTGKLVPVAIETGKAGGGRRQLVTPADGARWAVARAALTAADGTDHQLTWHIGRTHLLVNGLAATARRALSPRHPLMRLLGPHFAGTLSINNLAETTLLPPGDAVDALLPGPVKPMHNWAVASLRGVDVWAAAAPDELAARGVMDNRLAYPYRDDALRVWGALATFVDAYVDAWYADDAAVAGDGELAAWAVGVAAAGVGGFGEPTAAALLGDDDVGATVPAGATPSRRTGSIMGQRHGGGGGGGPTPGSVPAGTIRSRAGLVRLLTVVIFTASAQHAALNFPQKPLGSYTPALPLALMGDVPPPPLGDPSRKAHAAADCDAAASAAAVTAVLPSPLTASRQAFVYTLLGSVRVSRLGAYPWAPWPGGWFRHAGAAAAAARLRTRLAEVDAEVLAREEDEELPYTYLAPSNIPMSVDI